MNVRGRLRAPRTRGNYEYVNAESHFYRAGAQKMNPTPAVIVALLIVVIQTHPIRLCGPSIAPLQELTSDMPITTVAPDVVTKLLIRSR